MLNIHYQKCRKYGEKIKKNPIFVDYNVNEFEMFSEFRNSGAIDTSSHLLPPFGTLCQMAAMYLPEKQGATPHRQTHTQTPPIRKPKKAEEDSRKCQTAGQFRQRSGEFE